jgi:hypothetical protein
MKGGTPTGRRFWNARKRLGPGARRCQNGGLAGSDCRTWDSFSEEGRKRYLARQMEVNAAFLEHVDYHIGRVIDHIEEMGELDNTLVIYLTADNGCTAEGTPTGTFSELLLQNGFPPLTMDQQLEKLEGVRGTGCLGRAAPGQPLFRRHGPTPPRPRSSGPSRWPPISAEPCPPRPSGIPKRSRPGANGEGSFRTLLICSHDSGSDRGSGTRLCERSEKKSLIRANR